MIIRKAVRDDAKKVAGVYSDVHTAKEAGLVSCGWIRGVYPTEETANASFERDDLFVMEVDNEVIGTAIINKIQLEEYKTIKWQYEAPCDEVMVLHTFAISPKMGNRGYGKKFVEFAKKEIREKAIPYTFFFFWAYSVKETKRRLCP